MSRQGGTKLNPDASRELSLAAQGFLLVAGVDEVGRGCWAGPVVAGAVITPADILADPPEWVSGIRDSKVLSAKKRAALDLLIKENMVWAIGECSPREIDQLAISQATQLAMVRAIEALPGQPQHLLIDGRERINSPIPQTTIIDGDALCLSIAAASIIAKEYRDTLMAKADLEYPGYNFAKHVGYGTKDHITALKALKPCTIHRLSYKPIKAFLSQ